MQNTSVSMLDTATGRLLGGLMRLAMDHPYALAVILSGVAGASCAVLFDLAVSRQAGRP